MRERIIVEHENELPAILAEAMAAPRLSMDSETTSLEVYGPDLELVGVVLNVSEERGYYIPVGHKNLPDLEYQPRNLDKEVVAEFVREVGKHPNRIVFHNATYDHLVFWLTLGIHPSELPADDTAVMAHLMDENHPMNLEDLSRTYLGVQEERSTLPDGVDLLLTEKLLEPYTYAATATNGRVYQKKGLRLYPDWVDRYHEFFMEHHDGAVSFNFVTGLTQRLMAVIKKAGIIEFAGQFPKNFAYVPVKVAAVYAVDDGFNTLALHRHMDSMFFDLNPTLRKLYEDIERPVQEIMAAATRSGVKIDVKHLDHVREVLDERIKELADKAKALITPMIPAGDDRFDMGTILTSHKQLATLLFDVIGYRPGKRTGTGAPSTAKDVLEKLLGQKPRKAQYADDAKEFLQLKMNLGALQTLRSTFTVSILDLLDGQDMLHAFFNIIGTVSGRMSSQNPNAQNIPRLTPDELEDKPHLEGIDIRGAFRALPGYVFVVSDYTGMEMSGVAALSGDKNLKQQLAEGRDLHSVLARTAYNIGHELTDKEFKNIYSKERQDIKPVGFAIVYGGNEWTVSQKLGVDIKTAEGHYNAYFQVYPGVGKWMQQVYADLDMHKQVVYPVYGYVKRMRMPDPDLKISDPRAYDRQYAAAQRTCQNALIQGLCAFIVKEAVVAIDKQFKAEGFAESDAQIVLQVHDEIIVHARVEHAERVAQIMDELMYRKIEDVEFLAKAEFKHTLSNGETPMELHNLVGAA